MHSLKITLFLISTIVVCISAIEIQNDESSLLDRITRLEKSMYIDKLAHEKELLVLRRKIQKMEENSLALKVELDLTNGMLSEAMDIIAKLQYSQHVYGNNDTRHGPIVDVFSLDNGSKKDRRLLLPGVASTTVNPNHSVAFSARMTNHQENMGIHQSVQFGHVITNIGSGYDPVSGIFKAPVSGTYFFTVVIMSHAGEDIETEIVKNGVSLVTAYSGDSTTYNEGSQSTVVHLNIGDDVYVRIVNNAHVNDGNVRVYGGTWSSFSGFLIS